MYRSISLTSIVSCHSPFSLRSTNHRTFMRFTNHMTAVDRQEHLKLNTDNIMDEQQSTPATSSSTLHVQPIPLLDSIAPKMTAESFDVRHIKIQEAVTIDKSPLPFDEIPGPAVLKLWEKYWKYVPLLGTQLFCSVLINKFTHGKLNWNRNVTPLKYLFNEYGPIVRIHGPMMGDVVMIHRPEHIAEVFKAECDPTVRSGIDVLQHYRLSYRKNRNVGPFSAQGEEWLDIKADLTKPMDDQMSLIFKKLDKTCDDVIQRIRRVRNRQDEVPVTFHEDLTRWGMECFWISMLNRKLGFLEPIGYNESSEPARFIEALFKAHLYMSRCETGFQVWRFFETPFSRRLFDACDIIDAIISKHIRQSQYADKCRSTDGVDEKNTERFSAILETLLTSPRMNVNDVTTIMMDMIILGVQAMTNSVAFLLYFLAKNPRVQRKLFQEIYPLLPTRGASLTEDKLKNMPYLKACLQECHRLRPAFPYITRLLSKDMILHNYVIPKGTYLILANQISSQREENFEDPEKFRPERWQSNVNEEPLMQEYSCLPFGKGIRSCVGEKLATTQMMLLTAKLIREFRIEYDYADISSDFFMVNVPNKPLRFRFVDRD